MSGSRRKWFHPPSNESRKATVRCAPRVKRRPKTYLEREYRTTMHKDKVYARTEHPYVACIRRPVCATTKDSRTNSRAHRAGLRAPLDFIAHLGSATKRQRCLYGMILFFYFFYLGALARIGQTRCPTQNPRPRMHRDV